MTQEKNSGAGVKKLTLHFFQYPPVLTLLNKPKRKEDMKKIINGLLYNTSDATELHNEYSSLSQNDFRWFDETLYITKNKSFFLSGEGNGLSKYASTSGGTSTFGQKIIPLSDEEARAWLEHSSCDIDLITTYFKIQSA